MNLFYAWRYYDEESTLLEAKLYAAWRELEALERRGIEERGPDGFPFAGFQELRAKRLALVERLERERDEAVEREFELEEVQP